MSILIGIDIGSRYVKVVEFEYKNNLKLLNTFLFKNEYIPLQEQVIDKQIDYDSFWGEIKKYIPQERIIEAKIGVGIPANLITMLTLVLPKMPKSELEVAAKSEAMRRMIPASGPNHIFEYQLLAERIVAKIPRFEVAVVRADKLYALKIIKICKHIAVEPVLITSPSSGLGVMLSEESLAKNEDTVFVDIGFSSINTSIFHEGKLTFFRNTVYGIRNIIQDISANIGISQEKLEKIIEEKGIPDAAFDPKNKVAVAEEIMRQKYETESKVAEGEKKEEVNLLELHMLWRSHIERVLHELRRSLAYYREQSQGRRTENIFLLGGGCQIKNLVPLLAAQMGGKSQSVFPFNMVRKLKIEGVVNEINTTPIYTNATSLALGMVEKPEPERVINFLPEELKKKEVVAKRRAVFWIAEICLIILFGLLLGNFLLDRFMLSIAIKRSENQLGILKKDSKRLSNLEQLETELKQKESQIEKIIQKRQNPSLILQRLVKILPQEILFTELSISKISASVSQEAPGSAEGQGPKSEEKSSGMPRTEGISGAEDKYKINIKAQITADYEEAAKIIDRFHKRINGLGNFTNVKISPLKMEKVVPYLKEPGAELSLTQAKVRSFTITAEVNNK